MGLRLTKCHEREHHDHPNTQYEKSGFHLKLFYTNTPDNSKTLTSTETELDQTISFFLSFILGIGFNKSLKVWSKVK